MTPEESLNVIQPASMWAVCFLSLPQSLLPDASSSLHRDTRAILERQGTLENR